MNPTGLPLGRLHLLGRLHRNLWARDPIPAAPRRPQVELLIRANPPRLVEVVGAHDPARETEPPALMMGKLFAVMVAMPILGEMPVQTLPAKPGQKPREAPLSLQGTFVWRVSSADLPLLQRPKALEQAPPSRSTTIPKEGTGAR